MKFYQTMIMKTSQIINNLKKGKKKEEEMKIILLKADLKEIHQGKKVAQKVKEENVSKKVMYSINIIYRRVKLLVS